MFCKKIRKKYKKWRFFCLYDLFSVKKRGCLSYKKHLSLASLGRVSICCCFPSILLKRRALNEIIASLRYRNAEPSSFR